MWRKVTGTTSAQLQIPPQKEDNEESLPLKWDVILILSAVNINHIRKTKEFSSKFSSNPENTPEETGSRVVGNVLAVPAEFVSNTQEYGKTVEGRKLEQNLMRFS